MGCGFAGTGTDGVLSGIGIGWGGVSGGGGSAGAGCDSIEGTSTAGMARGGFLAQPTEKSAKASIASSVVVVRAIARAAL